VVLGWVYWGWVGGVDYACVCVGCDQRTVCPPFLHVRLVISRPYCHHPTNQTQASGVAAAAVAAAAVAAAAAAAAGAGEAVQLL